MQRGLITRNLSRVPRGCPPPRRAIDRGRRAGGRRARAVPGRPHSDMATPRRSAPPRPGPARQQSQPHHQWAPKACRGGLDPRASSAATSTAASAAVRGRVAWSGMGGWRGPSSGSPITDPPKARPTARPKAAHPQAPRPRLREHRVKVACSPGVVPVVAVGPSQGWAGGCGGGGRS